MQTGAFRAAAVSFLQLVVVLYDSVGLCQQYYIFVLPEDQHMRICEKVVTIDDIASFENPLHQLRHGVCRQPYRSVSALIFPQIWKAIVHIFCLCINCHLELDSKLVRFIRHVLNKSASSLTWK